MSELIEVELKIGDAHVNGLGEPIRYTEFREAREVQELIEQGECVHASVATPALHPGLMYQGQRGFLHCGHRPPAIFRSTLRTTYNQERD